MKIAPDGEILVRGENVTTGYFGAGADAANAFETLHEHARTVWRAAA